MKKKKRKVSKFKVTVAIKNASPEEAHAENLGKQIALVINELLKSGELK